MELNFFFLSGIYFALSSSAPYVKCPSLLIASRGDLDKKLAHLSQCVASTWLPFFKNTTAVIELLTVISGIKFEVQHKSVLQPELQMFLHVQMFNMCMCLLVFESFTRNICSVIFILLIY